MAKTGISGTGKKFEVLIFAGNINAYSIARAFNEAYAMSVSVYSRFQDSICADSEIIDFNVRSNLDDPYTFYKLICDFASGKGHEIIVLACNDEYVQLLSRVKGDLPANVIVPVNSDSLTDELMDKESFYEICNGFEIPYPKTFIHKADMYYDTLPPFDGPYVVKPSRPAEYRLHPFEGQKRAYYANDIREAADILEKIYKSGYEDHVLIQEYIPGDDSYMRILNFYSDRNTEVKMMCMGRVMLEERTAEGAGNHAVIITEEDPEFMRKSKDLLNEIHYTGFSNIDLKLDARDGVFKALDFNLRPGRSNYYVTISGANIAQLLVEDRIDEKDLELQVITDEHLWMTTEESTALQYVHKDYVPLIKEIIESGKWANPLLYGKDAKRRVVKKYFADSRNNFRKYHKTYE